MMADIAKAKRNVARMIDGGATEQEIDSYLASEKLSAAQLRGPAPTQRGTKRAVSTEIAQFLNEMNRNVPGASELSAAAGAISDVVQGRNRNFMDAFKTQRQQQNVMSQDLNVRRPLAGAFTRGTAQAAPLLIPGGQGAALPIASRNVNLARGAAASAAGGALNRAAIGEGTAQERLARASNPTAIALDVGLGSLAGRFVPTLVSPKKRISPEAQTLVRENVQLTPGQALGGPTKFTENVLANAPLMGPAITAARDRGIESFNRAAANRALQPIGKTLRADTPAGSEAIAETAQQLSRRYEDIVPKGGLDARDPQLAQDFAAIQNITVDMTDSAKNQLANIIKERVTNKITNGIIDGPAFKRIESDLTQKAGQFTKSPDPNIQDIGYALEDILDSLREGLARQNPAYAKALADTNKGYARLATLETAAGRAGIDEGIITPKQLREAYRLADKSVRRRATAQGRRTEQPFYNAATNVLAPKLGDTNVTAQIMNNPFALGGLGALAVNNPAVGIPVATGLGLGAAAYSKPAMDLFNRALAKNVSRRDADLALEQLGLLAAQNPQLRALYEQAAIRLGYAAQQPAPVNAMTNQNYDDYDNYSPR